MSKNAEQIAYSRIKTAIYKQYIRQGSRLAEGKGKELRDKLWEELKK